MLWGVAYSALQSPYSMIQERIDRIETTLRSADYLPETTREELLSLVTSLKAEVAALVNTHEDNAHSIAQHADASILQATKIDKDPETTGAAIEGLTASVEGFEASHPQLVSTVNRIAITLSQMGI